MIISGLILFLPVVGFSQGENNNWYFGNSAAITFNTIPPSALFNCALPNTIGYPVSISDSMGNLLFYSDGYRVFNRNHSLMPNGSLLYIFDGLQLVLSVKQLNNSNLYYLFHVYDAIPMTFLGLYYSVIDMDLDGGLGDVVPGLKNIPVPGMSDAMDLLSGTRHKNNRDVWIVNKKYNTNQYASILISNLGISSSIVLSNSYAPVFNVLPYNGALAISPDGEKLICFYKPQNDYAAEFCSFDSQSGEVTPLFDLKLLIGLDQGVISGVGFSPDSKLLYILGQLPPPSTIGGIFQYDISVLDSTYILNSQVQVYENDPISTTRIDAPFQIGLDWKLYFPCWYHDSLHVIHNPNTQGTGCNVQINAISLEGRNNYKGLPQFLQKYKAYINYTGNCQPDTFQFSSDIWPPADSLHWDFGDPASGAANYSNDSTPTHIYALPGQYTVELFVRHIDNRTDTSWKTITIYETPEPDLGPDLTICQGDSVTLDAGFCSGCSYEWFSIPPGFTSTSQTISLNQTGLYSVAVTTTNGCTGRDTVQLTVTVPPVVTNSPLSKSICSGETTNIPLTSTVPNTTFSWTAIGSSPLVTGFSPGIGDTINQVLTNAGSGPETVTYTITPAVGSCVGDSVQFVVTVTPSDSVMVSISVSADSVCAGTPVTFTATTTNGGSTPAFQWKVNGFSTGTNDSVFTYVPVNGDSITCVLTSSITICTTNNPAISNAIIMTIIPNLPISISIVASANPICEGDTVTFSGIAVNGGSTPVYQWLVNGATVGTNDSIFTYTPANDDSVRCILTSSETCTSSNPASSNPVIMNVNPLLLVSITISPSANPVCGGSPVTFTATPINGGSLPGYQWQVNGVNTGGNVPIYTYLPVDGDVVTCALNSNENCVTGNPATSNPITMLVGEQPDVSFSACFDTITTLNAKPYKLKGGIPLGGVYSGPGVDQITGYFNPAMAGLGTKTIIYSYTNWYNCSDNEVRSITVVSPVLITCGNDLLDIRDSTVYPTVLIGSQCWMAANLNYGTEIPYITPQRDNCIPEKYTNPAFVYQWDELMKYSDTEQAQGLCPPGWQVPSEADWNTLFANWTNNAFAGAPLKYSGYSGFNALLVGAQFFNKVWEYDAFATFFWSSTPHGPWKAWAHGMNEYNYSVSYYPSYRSNAFSVRCVRD